MPVAVTRFLTVTTTLTSEQVGRQSNIRTTREHDRGSEDRTAEVAQG